MLENNRFAYIAYVLARGVATSDDFCNPIIDNNLKLRSFYKLADISFELIRVKETVDIGKPFAFDRGQHGRGQVFYTLALAPTVEKRIIVYKGCQINKSVGLKDEIAIHSALK